jgi:hypothetical protein
MDPMCLIFSSTIPSLALATQATAAALTQKFYVISLQLLS